MRPDEIGRLTKYGEARIDKCYKLDMGGGYRLIYLKDVSTYIFLYLGTHDECDRWLKHHTGFEAFMDDARYKIICMREEERELHENTEVAEAAESDCEKMLMKKIDDKILRRIFCGLSGEQI